MPLTDENEVWTFDEGDAAGEWASINRPHAAPRHETELPRGKHPFQLYSLSTPNGRKVTIMFEELLAAGHTGAEYDAWRIDIGEGGQFGSDFTAINPNQKIPALLDLSSPDRPLRLFESGAILLHLADKFGAFIPDDPQGRAETLNWLFWQMGAGPYLGGGFGHFYAYAPERIDYALDRFTMEVKRQLDLMNRTLADRRFLAGDDYTIADIASWPWYGRLVQGKGYEKADVFLDAASYPHVMRWADEIDVRPAVKRGKIVNMKAVLPNRHSAKDVDTALSAERSAADA